MGVCVDDALVSIGYQEYSLLKADSDGPIRSHDLETIRIPSFRFNPAVYSSAQLFETVVSHDPPLTCSFLFDFFSKYSQAQPPWRLVKVNQILQVLRAAAAPYQLLLACPVPSQVPFPPPHPLFYGTT